MTSHDWHEAVHSCCQTERPRSLLLIAFRRSLFGLWHIVTNVYLIEPGRWQNAIHYAGFAFLASVTISPFGTQADKPRAWLFDIAYGLLVAAAALWGRRSRKRSLCSLACCYRAGLAAQLGRLACGFCFNLFVY